VQPTEPIKETVHHDTKPSLRHLNSIDSAALKPPEVSSPHRPHSPPHTGPSGELAHPKKEGEEVKPLEASSSARGSGGSGGSASFNWASIKVGALLLSVCVLASRLVHCCCLCVCWHQGWCAAVCVCVCVCVLAPRLVHCCCLFVLMPDCTYFCRDSLRH